AVARFAGVHAPGFMLAPAPPTQDSLLRQALGVYAGPFLDLDQLPTLNRLTIDLFEVFHATARPANGQSIDLRLIVQTEVKPRAVLRRKAGTGRDQTRLLLSLSLDCDQSTDCVAITFHSLQFHRQPIASLSD